LPSAISIARTCCPKYGAWVQDDWHVTNRLTLNLGVRYDLIWNAFAQHRSFDKWMAANRPQDADNLQPRLGFAYAVNDRTVVRGGAGLYYADIPAAALNWAQLPQKVAFIGCRCGRPGRLHGQPVQRTAARPTTRRCSASAT
jgi:hypothetical protein